MKDPYMRPKLHFSPQRGWINDPNGLIHARGRYHLFAQHHPYGLAWGPMHWLHATSPDLLHWQEEGIALCPDEHGTMFSGSAVQMQDGRIALMYTAHGEEETQCVAFSGDGMHYEKYPGNPVIANPGYRDFRDPKIFVNPVRGGYGVAVAAGDHVAFYHSMDLISFERTGEFRPETDEGIFECPDCFPLRTPEGEEVYVLLASMIDARADDTCRVRYWLGSFDGDRFIPREGCCAQRLETGYDSYAATTFFGTQERLLMTWLSKDSHPLPLDTHCGCLSLPRALSLVRTAQGLRLAQRCILPEGEEDAAAIQSGCFVIDVSAQGDFTLALMGEEEEFSVSLCGQEIRTRRAKNALLAKDGAYNRLRETREKRLSSGPMQMQIVCDGYAVEIFADGGLYAHALLLFARTPVRAINMTGEAGFACRMLK